MEARLQRRIQRYGWDRAASDYEHLWRAQLGAAHTQLLARASLRPGQRVLDVACGTGLIALAAAEAVGPLGEVVGVDLSAQMVEALRQRAHDRGLANVQCARMDAEKLALHDASFDVALCALGLMFVPDPELAVREMRRVLRPGGRAVIAVWGERSRCGWSTVFPIVEAEVASDVCPLFFRLGNGNTLARVCADARLEAIDLQRVATTMAYADADEACSAAFVGGPMALAWSRFDDGVRARVRERYVESIAPWRHGRGFRIPGEFVVVSASVPAFR
ncbi:MAG TPA: methyltransferase domain-containing protein [Burkholderiaceae bacterium]|nr:methyltransferase domain-containing protein [Burkholderiaceae bacterium]